MEADWGYFTNAKINTSGDKMSAEKHWERAYAILLEASNKKIAELKEKLQIAIEALGLILLQLENPTFTDSRLSYGEYQIYNDDVTRLSEALEKIK